MLDTGSKKQTRLNMARPSKFFEILRKLFQNFIHMFTAGQIKSEEGNVKFKGIINFHLLGINLFVRHALLSRSVMYYCHAER